MPRTLYPAKRCCMTVLPTSVISRSVSASRPQRTSARSISAQTWFAAALREFLQPVRLLERILDAADDVRPVGRLRAPAALGGELRAGCEVIQPRDDGRRAEIDGGGTARAPRLTGWRRQCAREDRTVGALRQCDGVAVRGVDPHARRGTPLTGHGRHLPQRPFPPQAAGME